jgi:pimeloyl-ACP methyl ester carboxylesterase
MSWASTLQCGSQCIFVLTIFSRPVSIKQNSQRLGFDVATVKHWMPCSIETGGTTEKPIREESSPMKRLIQGILSSVGIGCSHRAPLAEESRPTAATQLRHQLAAETPTRFVLIENVKLAYSDPDELSGRPVIVCLHAIGHGGRDFTDVRARFGNAYRIITLDWPGQGLSASDAVAASIARYHLLFSKFVDLLQIDRFILLGNSIGGAVAIKYASLNPTRIQALVLSNPAGLDKGGLLAPIFIWWMEQKMARGTRLDPAFMPWFQDYYTKVLVTEHARAERDRIVASAYEIAQVLEQAWRSFRQKDGDLRADVGRIRAPVLIAWAEKDEFVRWDRSADAVATFANHKIVFFAAGHSPFLETPTEFNQELGSFLSTIGT